MKQRAACLAIFLPALLIVSACASNSPPKLPYPAFQQADTLPDMFVAALPGVRAKPLAGDMRTRSSSMLLTLPDEWKGTTGGAPGKAVELFVLAGELTLSDIEMKPGSYAYVPPGSLGFRIETDKGAQLLYFLDDVDETSVIRSPLIMNSGLLSWTETLPGHYVKELRSDPGSGARSWLLRIEAGAPVPWTASSTVREGFLVSGEFQDSECFNGESQSWHYTTGGYFLRPPDAYNGGPEATATIEATWFLREQSAGVVSQSGICFYAPPADPDDD